jgi:hypothetical protein
MEKILILDYNNSYMVRVQSLNQTNVIDTRLVVIIRIDYGNRIVYQSGICEPIDKHVLAIILAAIEQHKQIAFAFHVWTLESFECCQKCWQCKGLICDRDCNQNATIINQIPIAIIRFFIRYDCQTRRVVIFQVLVSDPFWTDCVAKL